ncbi:MAG: PAS domain S-box protein [Pseudomonadota bacterium]
MPAAPLPPDEARRQALLDSLGLLDTAPEPVFDQITRLASRLLGFPITLFTLIDRDRQWFKSRVGLPLAETPRTQSFCAHALLQSDPMVVPDASVDERFRDNPFVTGPAQVRFYAGVPIRSLEGLPLGTLCAVDTRPRTLGADQLLTLIELAEVIAREVHYRERLALAGHHVVASTDALQATEARLHSIFELASVGIGLIDRDFRFLGVNPAITRILGYSIEELERLTVRDVTHPDDMAASAAWFQRLRDGEIEEYAMDKRYLRKDGATVWVSLHVSRKTDAAGEIEYFIGFINDISAQKAVEQELNVLHANLEARVAERTRELQEANARLSAALARQQAAEQALKAREAQLSSVIANANDAYIALDAAGRVTAWNRAAEETFGWSAQEAAGATLDRLIIPPEMAAQHAASMARYLHTGDAKLIDNRLEVPAMRKDGSRLMIEIRIRALEVNGETLFSAFLHDISERKRAEAQREYENRHDPLTNLLNRRALMEMLPRAQARAARRQSTLALLFLDLDGFKAVNDSFGHDAGDELLRVVAQRLLASVRVNDSVFRLAGDEFTLVLEDLDGTAAGAQCVAAKLLKNISEPIPVGKANAHVGVSIGIALYTPGSGRSAEELIKEADSAMYEAKKAGRGRVWPAPSDEF